VTRVFEIALRLAAALLFAAGLPAVSAAQTPSTPASQVPVTVGTVGGDVTVLADRLEEVGPERLLVATGNVEITRGKARLIADRVEINRESGDTVAQGRVVFYDGEDQLTGRRIDYNVRTGTGVVYDSEARVAPYYRIAGERMERLDESHYLQRFTPRRPRSRWSRINREKAEALIAEGRMRPGGLQEVERAKDDGRWEEAYDSPTTATVPDDFRQALDAEPAARDFFQSLGATKRYSFLYRIQDAKRLETRAKRIAEYVELLRAGRTLS